jgi:multidrug resistance efflux pump
VALLGVVGTGAYAYALAHPFRARADLVLHKVHKGRLELAIVERGALEAATNADIVCKVKARSQNTQNSTTIKWVINDGSHVKKGQLLADLDDSGLLDQLQTESITLDKDRSDWLQAEENYKIQLTQNESDILAAENALKLAQIELKKFLEGDYPSQLSDLEGKAKTANSDLEQQRNRAAWAQRMVKKGYQTVSQAQAEKSKLESYELAKKKAETDLRVLKGFTKEHDETNYRNKVREAELGLQKARSQAKAQEVAKRTDRDAKKLIFDQQASKVKDIQEEIKKCKLVATRDGLVVYYIPEQTRWGVGRQAVVAQGEQVAENQKLMQIPDLKHMLVNTKVHEALASRVRPGQPATIRVLTESMADRKLKGHVESVANTASQQDFFAADVKVYATKVVIDEELDTLKPGMTAEVTINVADARENVLTVPVEAVVGAAEMGPTRKCFVTTPRGPEERSVTIGMSNEKEVEVTEGLQEGDEVVLNPKVLVGDKAKTRQRSSANGNSKEGPAEEKAGPAGVRRGGGLGQVRGGTPASPGAPGAGPGGPGAGSGSLRRRSAAKYDSSVARVTRRMRRRETP